MKKTLDANKLKLIAIIAMTLDHIAWLLFPGYSDGALPVVMHIIGRLTCPIMCYFIAEGYYHTRNIRKYTFRLFLFAVISHFAYIFASNDFVDARSFIPFYFGSILNQTSVMWPLAWGLVMLRVANSERFTQLQKTLLVILICLVSFPSDWSCIASLCVLAFGTNRGDLKAQGRWMLFFVAIYAVVYFFALDKLYGILQLAVALSLLARYNGQRGKNARVNKFLKWFFYLYYPLHLTILGAINEFERANMLERQREGVAIAKREGKYKGRKKTVIDDVAGAYHDWVTRHKSKATIARENGISRPTLDRLLKEYEREVVAKTDN